jgi:hypothetical protein
MSWKLDSSHAVSADGTQCDRCGVVAREFAATMPCLYEPIDPTSPAALPVSEEPRREEPDRLLRIAGLVNGYHNDGTKLSAAETLAAIADVLGDPFDFSSSAVVVGADQHALREALSAARDALAAFGKQAGWLPGQQAYSATMTDAEMKLAQAVVDIDQILAIPPALPDPGSPEREKERTERR